jgi:hypothetical protein
VQRAYVKGQMRYYRFVEDKISLLVDWNYPKIWYDRKNPFDAKKVASCS